ncbi:N-acetyltransferase 9-like protein isoform X1 [Haliotis rufescens]|uniref:N-acetyltransferase 9-like protein isoform X1 n=1 Tax=Haliotis rufescens TaxID=6454 RepID=UPI00201F22CC|nr:N-acetyltransferase 9-like protein isoform X1 [Haliotis rufescens]
MRINENTFLFGCKVVLVPYERHHVPEYHKWMQSEELQELTASEPLSLEEEYAMQEAWRQDQDKCTFIILDADLYQKSGEPTQYGREKEAMVGDVNLFFNEQGEKHVAEIEIMIAESSARGRGLGKEALLSMMRYGIEALGLTKITAKIGFSNAPSLAMFNKLGFVEVSRSDMFKEVTLEMVVDDQAKALIQTGTAGYTLQEKPGPS